MKKYIYRMLICLMAAFALFAVNAAAEETNACGDALTWAYADGTLTISGNGPMYDYEEGAAPWAAYKDQITKVVFSGNVTTVGSYAFKDYDAITDVDFGSAMHTLGANSFAQCDGLTSVSLPVTFRIFGEQSLYSCKNLKAIHCYGPFPSFKLNCLWDSYVTIYYPASSPWSVDLIAQLEEAFHGRIEFLDSDGNDHYTPEETTEATTQPTTEATTAPTTAPSTAPTTEPTTTPTTAPTTAPTTEATTAPTEQTTFPYTFPTDPTEPEKHSGSGVGLALIGFTLALVGLGILIFRPKKKKGRYSR